MQVGTAVMYHGLEVFREITSDLEKFMMRKGYQRVDEMVGLAHQK